MSVANIIYDEEQRYLDARYDLIKKIVAMIDEYLDRKTDADDVNGFVCEYSKEIDDAIKTFNKEQ